MLPGVKTRNSAGMRRGTARSGRGSNQYRKQGSPAVHDVQSRFETEAAAWAFTDEDGLRDRPSLRGRDWELQSRWAAHPNPEVRAQIAGSKNTDPAVLEALSTDRHPWVLEALAGNPRSPRHVVAVLADSEWGSVRFAALQNPQFDREELRRRVLSDPDQIGVGVAACPHLDEDVIRWLADGADGETTRYHDIGMGLTKNPNTPPDVLTKIADDNCLDRDGILTRHAVSHPNFPVDQLQRWAQFRTKPSRTGKNIRMGVASHPQCPTDVLKTLAYVDPDQYVRRTVALHASTSPQVLQDLAIHDRSNKVNAAAILHPDCPEDAIVTAVAMNRSSAVQIAGGIVRQKRGFDPWAET